MRISVLTIFPEFFGGALAEGMVREALEQSQLEVNVVPLRDFTDDSHRTTDDYPFGGGPGMVMKIEPIDRALQSLSLPDRAGREPTTRVVLLSPQGVALTQERAIGYSRLEHLVL